MRSATLTRFGPAARLLALSALALCLPVHALYKVVGPDGKVTYSDRAPGPSDGRITALGASGSVISEPLALPFELREVAARYPVTLYAFADCSPCDSARALLRQRGIPFAERLVLTEEDAAALQRLTGTREGPTLMIGQKPLPGFSAETWNAYLDSAGYPKESRLPASYQYPAATALTERAAPARAVPAAPRAPAEAPAAAAPTASPTGIRF
jgi:glutaredoxin